jgi:DNA modification methylase
LNPGASFYLWHADMGGEAGRDQGTTLLHSKPARNGEHPTMKPVALFEQLIRNSCPKGGIVLDPFAGSGTTLIAAESTGRMARVLELDPRYCDVIVKRWEQLTGRQAERKPKGQPQKSA